jgi:hypothetical protein
VPWTEIYRELAANTQWTPEQIGRLTPRQVLAMVAADKSAGKIKSGEAYMAARQRQEAERAAWGGS